ncbi:MAG: putative glycosyltransferase [Gemmatimonadetes bacterium]|nr:putative glycosyltransferase [Gemmatimonadota bacterium]
MRALILSHFYADPTQRQKLRELAGLGWSVTLALPGGTADMDGAIRIAPIPASGSATDPDGLRWSGRVLRRILTDVRPDIVQIEEEPGSQAAHAAVREARRLGIPAVLFSWQSLPLKRGFLEQRRFRRTMAGASGVIGGNRLAQALLTEAAPAIPSLSLPQTGVVPPAASERTTGASLAIAYVGRLTPERGPDRLLRACGQLLGPWTLVVAGTGPEQEALEDLAQKLGLAARTRWLGALSKGQIASLWAEVDCLVAPSRSTPEWVERASPVVLDAMAHGVAVVASTEGALPELVGDAGLLFQTEEELLISLQELLTAPARRLALGQAGRKRVLDRYVDAAIARSTDTFWREVLARQAAQ